MTSLPALAIDPIEKQMVKQTSHSISSGDLRDPSSICGFVEAFFVLVLDFMSF
jgi:hypothetical protein